MSWELRIHIIDVGQGESSLIIARDPTTGQQRSMLIDAGLAGRAETVHNYITSKGLTSVDHILISHYDADHSDGIIALLRADNLYRICEVIAQAAGDAAFDSASYNLNTDRDHEIAAAAAAATATALGGYNDTLNNNDYSNIAVQAGRATWPLVFNPGSSDDDVANDGIGQGETMANTLSRNDLLLPLNSKLKRRQAAVAAGIEAGTTAGNAAARSTAALDAVFDVLESTIDKSSRFQTGGIYHNVHIIDIGDTAHVPKGYTNAVDGKVLYTSSGVELKAPGINRQRTSNPNLGNEVLWNSGPVQMNAPLNSPAVFVLSCRRYVWNAPPTAVPITSGQPDNDDSIGLILRFNNFYYYTGGDLPYQGEKLIADAIMVNGLPNPAGGTFAIPHRIACFKCGHHGSSSSTIFIPRDGSSISLQFLTTAKPRGAFISCGTKYQHPDKEVIDALHNDANIEYFYLTNCNYDTNHIPASQGNNSQLTVGNRSRIAGDNNEDNLAAGRQRGDIRILIDEAESSSNATIGPQPLRQYRVRYYENDNGVQSFRPEFTIF